MIKVTRKIYEVRNYTKKNLILNLHVLVDEMFLDAKKYWESVVTFWSDKYIRVKKDWDSYIDLATWWCWPLDKRSKSQVLNILFHYLN